MIRKLGSQSLGIVDISIGKDHGSRCTDSNTETSMERSEYKKEAAAELRFR
jgi:hypothetical protein